MSETGLDYEFLQYIGHNSEAQKEHQRFYLQFFEGHQRVVDLGCGNGEFVELLRAQGVDAVGVDVDPIAVGKVRDRGIPAVCEDAFTYLEGLAERSVDGVFAAHLVEHLPYDRAIGLLLLAYRALKPGGVIVLTTPDPRSLHAHLEMFYMHFGHVSFYHPRLLCFFLDHVGFENPSFGGHASSVHPPSPVFGLPDMHPIEVNLPVWKRGLFRRALRAVRMASAYLFLKPYLDLIQSNFTRIAGALDNVDRPFECYAWASKPMDEHVSNRDRSRTGALPEQQG
jgi:SAM-dependent methyltransferase